jgi:hypothetical protein
MSAMNLQRPSGSMILATLLLVSGGIALFVGSHNFPIRAVAMLAVLASVHLVRRSHASVRHGVPETNGGVGRQAKGPGRALWIVSAALAVLLGVSLFLMYLSEANGGHVVWPVYLFAGVGLLGAVVWSYLAVMIRSSRDRN